ncbi:MAG: hypothetical protein KGI82_10100 [Betaproteobacteria bacterium]|nr:hypothetical protein [Betaproteobacteria bacterium]
MAIFESPQSPAGEGDGDLCPVPTTNGSPASKTKLRPHAKFHAHRWLGFAGVTIWSKRSDDRHDSGHAAMAGRALLPMPLSGQLR